MAMKIEILEESEFKVRFILYDAPVALANSFRRAMKSLVPTMAVDYVDFYMNFYMNEEVVCYERLYFWSCCSVFVFCCMSGKH